jgi:hypothetical protein
MGERVWRTIKSAPKNGIVIWLTWMENGKPQDVAAMCWDPSAKNGLFPGKIGMWVAPDQSFTWNGDGDGGPTHWAPIKNKACAA